MSDTFSRAEIITGRTRARHLTAEQKLAIVAETSLISLPRVIAAHSNIGNQEHSGRGLPRGRCSFGSINDGRYLQTMVPFGMRVAGWPFVLRQ